MHRLPTFSCHRLKIEEREMTLKSPYMWIISGKSSEQFVENPVTIIPESVLTVQKLTNCGPDVGLHRFR